MKIEEVLPVVEPDYRITLNKDEYSKLIVVLQNIRHDGNWNPEFCAFFQKLLDTHHNT